MDGARWERVEALFAELVEASPAERAARLAACADPALRAEVEALLTADAAAEPYLTALRERVVRPALEAAFAAAEVPVGERVGPYCVTGLLGRGGMGTVYRAERADGVFAQAVALKVVHGGLGPEGTARFLAERRILARLQHPGIARLYDGGLAADGRPWLAMELVEGEPITLHVRRHRLPVRARLALFARACDAVAYAHRNLVVHRDLKPAHLVVTAEGDVKLLDFGVAKLLEPEPLGMGGPLTRAGAPITPEYAAPEQVRGEPVTAATDVYALGVVLYELLAGRTPYRLRDGGRYAVERAVLETEPERLTPCPSLPDRPRGLPADLHAIVQQALRKEPDRRYGTVEALADDVRRFLEGLPVRACPDTLRYRVRKFVGRHRPSVAAGLLAVTLLLAALGAALVQGHRAAEEAARARSEAAKAEQILAFVTNLFKAANPNVLPGEYVTAYAAHDVSARAALQRGVEQAEALADQPAVQAELLAVISETLLGIGAVEEALPTAERVLALRRALHAEGDPATPLEDLAESLHAYAQALFQTGRVEAALPLFEEAEVLWSRLPGGAMEQLGRTLLVHGAALATLARHEEAAARYAQALHLFGVSGAADQQVEALYLFGALHRHRGDLREAERVLQEGLRLARLRQLPDPLQQASLEGYLGIIRLEQGDLAAAERLLRGALPVLAERLPRDHRAVLRLRIHLGAVLVRQERHEEALLHLREPYALRLARFGPAHIETAEAGAWLGGAEAGAGHYERGEALLLQALATFERYRGPDDRYVRMIRDGVAELYRRWGRPEQAAAVLTGRLLDP